MREMYYPGSPQPRVQRANNSIKQPLALISEQTKTSAKLLWITKRA